MIDTAPEPIPLRAVGEPLRRFFVEKSYRLLLNLSSAEDLAGVTVENRRPWLTRNVRVLSLVSLLQDTASELLYPLLPIYLTAVLGAPPSVVGASRVWPRVLRR